MNPQYVFDPRLGIIIYRGVIKDTENIINKLESGLEKSNHDIFKWDLGTTGDLRKDKGYRNCSDFKIHPDNTIWENFPEVSEIKEACEAVKSPLLECLYDYEVRHGIKMDFMESFNFVKYIPGEHFSAHADHGYSYNCTVSSVAYLNDDYEGGELVFDILKLKIKPKVGDIILFPSTYIYAHSSIPVISGTKYAVVTMFDYNERTHKGFQYGHNLDGSPADPNAGKAPRFRDRMPGPIKQLDSDYSFSGI
jgi:hypothetical protein